MKYFLRLLLVMELFLTSCSFPGRGTATPGIPIDAAVATTLASIATRTPAPLPTLIPTATPLVLKGLFCEYQFCIGHPQDMAFYDVNAQQNVGAPSTYSAGILASYNANLGRYMENTQIIHGRDGNMNSLLSAAKNYDAIRQSFKGAYKDLKEEQQSHVRGGAGLAYDQKR